MVKTLRVVAIASVLVIALAGCNKKEVGVNSDKEVTVGKKVAVDKEMAALLKTTPELPASDFIYELSDDGSGVKIAQYKGQPLVCRIPEKIDGMPVVEISGGAFYKTKGLTTVIMPDTIVTIGSQLFASFNNLETVKLSSSLKTIPSSAFFNCKSLKKLTIPNSVTEIEGYAFRGSGLETIYIPDSVTEIGENAFEGCSALQSVRLSPSMKRISRRMFASCKSLSTLDIPRGITEIKDYAFPGCSSLSSFTIPDSVTKLSEYAFASSGLVSIEIPDSVTEFKCSFIQCDYLTTLRLPNTLTRIENGLFYRNNYKPKNLQSVNLPASLKSMASYGFYKLENLTELIIPDSLTEIEFEETVYSGLPSAQTQFLGTSLNLATQKRLKDLGYTGKFTY